MHTLGIGYCTVQKTSYVELGVLKKINQYSIGGKNKIRPK